MSLFKIVFIKNSFKNLVKIYSSYFLQGNKFEKWL